MYRRTTASFRTSVTAIALSVAALAAGACSDAPSTAPASAPPVVTPLPTPDVEPYVVLFAGSDDPADAARVTERLIQLAPSLRVATPAAGPIGARALEKN